MGFEVFVGFEDVLTLWALPLWGCEAAEWEGNFTSVMDKVSGLVEDQKFIHDTLAINGIFSKIVINSKLMTVIWWVLVAIQVY